MPSLRSLSVGLLLALVQLSSATPLPQAPAGSCGGPRPDKPPVLPLTGTGTELPGTDTKLVAVTIGRGTQNYTCSAIGAKPVAIGAIATLYDVTPLASFRDGQVVHSIPARAVYVPNSPTGYNLPAPIGNVQPMGDHFFSADGTPVFNLATMNKIFFGKKNAGVKAPADADKGPAGNGAVDWLQLGAKDGYGSAGVGITYRVVTAGGVAVANCTSTDVLLVEYATEYWFYE